jgi:Mce-associated membrane protein
LEDIVAIKLSRKTNHKNVFTRVIEDADPPEPKDAKTVADASDSEAAETLEDTAEGKKDLTTETAADHVAEETSDAAGTDDGETDDGDTTETETHTTVSAPRRRWLRFTLTGTAILVFIAALAAAGFFGWQYKQHEDVERASRAALLSAENFAVILTSIDTNGIDENFNQVVDGSTGEFKSMYSQSASQLRQLLIDNKAVSKGTVIDSAVKSASKTKVDVVMFIDQWITNAASPEPRMDRSRVAMTMELVDGRWLASNVELK